MPRHQARHLASSRWRASQAASGSTYTSGSRSATDITQVNGRSGVTVTAWVSPGSMAAAGVVLQRDGQWWTSCRPGPRLGARLAVVGAARPRRGSNVDDGLDRAVGGGESAHQHGGGEQPAADLGHHAFGEGQPPAVGLPGRLEGGGLGTVAAGDDGGGVGGAETEPSGGRLRRPGGRTPADRRSGGCTASRWSRRSRPARRCGCRRAARSPRSAAPSSRSGAASSGRRGGGPGRCRRRGGRRGSTSGVCVP